MQIERAIDLIKEFANLRILVIGDFMLDQYIWGRVTRISPEAPVPIVNVEKETFSPGGAGHVATSLRALNASVTAIGILGRDDAGDRLADMLKQLSVDARLFREARPTTQKTRIVAHQQQVARVDREQTSLIDEELQNRVAREFIELLPGSDAVIVSDYNKGSLTPGLLAKILPEARKQNKLVCLDPKPRYFSSYTPVSILTPNQAEASSVLGYQIITEDDLAEAGRRIRTIVDCEALLVTRGEKGMALFAGDNMTLIPAHSREVYDVTGAGDTVISVLCAALAGSFPLLDAVRLANLAAGIVVGKLGAADVTAQELISSLTSSDGFIS